VGPLAGRRIAEVRIVTQGPVALPGGVGALLHVTTREETIRSRLLFSAGDTLDTLRVAESVRRLRRLRYLHGAAVMASCDSAGGVVLAVVTRDAWSMQPRLSAAGSGTAVAGVEETNLLGTGRAGRIYARSDHGQLGVGAAYTDPSLLGARLVATISHDSYGDGGAWSASAQTREAGVFDAWGFSASARKSARRTVTPAPGAALGDSVYRTSAAVLARRRLSLASGTATYLLVGAELERTLVVSGPDLPLAGPSTVRRTFAGMDIGVGRRAGQFTTIPWLVPVTDEESARLAPPEVPVGLEGEGVVAVGRDVTAARPAARVDLWLGRVWSAGTQRVAQPAALATQEPRAVIAADLWASGFRPLTSAGEWSAGAIRSSITAVSPAPRGLWLARLSGEHLMDPDPDVRRLLMGDDAQHALPPGSRLAEFAVSGSLERTIPLLGARRGFVLDGAMFVAASARWDVAVPLSAAARSAGLLEAASDLPVVSGMEHVHLGSVGLGLRLSPTRFGQSTFGLDVGVPLLRSPAVRGRPYFALSIRPAFGRNRGRGSGSVP
jgi:acyl-coenzyme A thioesterase PaaI-like protein